jgi:undecaprenyl-diphosphatase
MPARISRVGLILGPVLATVLVVLFLLLAREVRSGGPITRFDNEASYNMAELRERVPAVRVLLYGLTLLGAFETMLILVPLGALFIGLRKGWLVALVWIVCGLGVGLSNKYIKHYYDRPRPGLEVRDRWVYEDNESFPSGHASAAMGIFGMLTYLLTREAPTRRLRLIALIGMGLLILAIGFSRIFLCAHFVSDVIGGYLLGGTWLILSILALEGIRARGSAS